MDLKQPRRRERDTGRAWRGYLLGAVGGAAFLVVWQVATLGNQRTDVPGPWLTAEALVDLLRSGLLLKNVIASVFRVAWGFVLAAALGIPLGLAIGWTSALRAATNPLMQALRPISPIAWLPMATLIFGGVQWFEPSDLASIFLIFLSSFFPIVTATASAVNSADLKYLRSAQNFDVKGFELMRRVVLPAALPQILTGLRLALGIAWVVVVAAEMLGVQSGLGYQINDARNKLRYDHVAAAMVTIGMTGFLLDWSIARVERSTLTMRGALRR